VGTVVLRGLDVVDGAWADDDDEAVIGVIKNGLNGLAGSDDGLPGRQRERELLAQTGGREERANVADAGILSALREAACELVPASCFESLRRPNLGYRQDK
jgi:hypothetical protein